MLRAGPGRTAGAGATTLSSAPQDGEHSLVGEDGGRAEEDERLDGQPVPGIAHGVEQEPDRYDGERRRPHGVQRAARAPRDRRAEAERCGALEEPE